VAAFLSCLILARQGRVVLEQDAPFADIVVRPATAALDASA
jgi:chromatin segregation and condensation protein Rec8/ScpA/Scc1 (kleisin family)